MVLSQKDKNLLQRGAKTLVSSLLAAETEIPYRSSFRGSNMPICERDLALTMLSERCGFLPRRRWSFFSDFFVSVGTATHEVIQRWLNRSAPSNHNPLWGNWACPKCKKKVVLTNKSECPSCGSEMAYREIAFNLGGFTGRMDGLIQLIPGLDLFLVLEIKTTSTEKLIELPYPSYVAQATIYKDCLLEQHGIKTVGLLFLFVPRDSLTAMKPVIYFDGDLEDRILKTYQRKYEKVLSAVKNGKIDKLDRLCASRAEADASFKKCPWRVVCFSGFSLDEIVRRRCA